MGLRKTEYVVRGRSSPASLAWVKAMLRRGPHRPRQARRQSGARPTLPRVSIPPIPALASLTALPWRPLLLGAGGGLLVLLVASWLLFEAAYADRVHPGVRALGVDLGGKTLPEAHAALAERIALFGQEPLVFQFDDREWRTTPLAVGLRLEVAPIAEAAYAVGREGNPLGRLLRPLHTWFGSRTVPQPAITLDTARARQYLEEIAAAVDRPMENARLSIDRDGRVQYQPSRTARRLNVARTLDRLRTELMVGEALVVPLVVEETPPPITDADLARAREQAERLLSAPVVLQLGSDTWDLAPPDIAALIELEGPPERPQGVRLKEPALQQAVRRLVRQIDQPAANARFEFVGGELRVLRESREGREVDEAALLAAVRTALWSTERTVEVPARITQPAVTSEHRTQLGIRELVARGETRFAGSSPPKIHNIKLAASRLHGVVVPPGAMFSFNRELGPTTLDAGYQVGWGITATGSGGHATVPSVAGGICQVATTLFQPVFWGGYQIEERHHHLYWIPAYGAPPLGRIGLDATVDEDAGLDFRFVNSSPDYLLIQAVTDDTTLSISLYGNKPTWTVKVDGPTITNRKPASPEVVYQPEPSLPWGQRLQVESAGDGFDVTITRTVIDEGQTRTLNLRTHYEPAQNLIVVGVRGAPPGAVEEIRAANARPTPNPVASSTVTGTPTITPAPPTAATTAPTAARTGAATPVPAGATTAPLPATVPAAGPPTAAVPALAPTTAPTRPPQPTAAPTTGPAPTAAAGARGASGPAAPTAAPAPATAAPVSTPAVPRFGAGNGP